MTLAFTMVFLKNLYAIYTVKDFKFTIPSILSLNFSVHSYSVEII